MKTRSLLQHRHHFYWPFLLIALGFAVLGISILASSSAQAASQPLLWQVVHKDLSGKAYLFGSLHYGKESFYPLPISVMSAYESSDSLAVELDIDAISAAHLNSILQTHGFYSGDRTLETRASSDLWQKLSGVCNKLSLEPESFIRTKPWLVAMQLVNVQLARSQYQQSLGLDKYFLSLARNKKPILALESLTEQIELFAHLDEAEQMAFLLATLDEFDSTNSSLDKLADAWIDGNESALNTLILTTFQKQKIGKQLYPIMFVERNKRMAMSIISYMKSSQKIFLVVGVGHMLGEDGLVTLLKQAGYQVTRVN